jgi:hypothetical protein
MRIHQLACATVVGLALAVPAAAQSTDVSGTWKASFVTPDRTYPATIELKQDGEKLSGTLLTEAKDKITGTVKGTNLSFTFQTLNPNGDGTTLAIGVTCALENGALSGEFTVNGDAEGTFSAQKDAAAATTAEPAKADANAKVDITGAWALSVELGTISATPSAVFKQEGENLAGQYTSQQYGTFPLKGTLKGNQLQFTFTMTIEGNAIDVLFSGTADASSIKGSVNYGGIGEGTFTGTKK